MSVTGNTEQLQPQTQTIIDQQKQNVCWCDLKKKKKVKQTKNQFSFQSRQKEEKRWKGGAGGAAWARDCCTVSLTKPVWSPREEAAHR